MDFEKFLDEKFAWPGGYALHAVLEDGDELCFDCCEQNADVIRNADPHSGWKFIGVDINWEDDALYCAHCAQQIKPEYTP